MNPLEIIHPSWNNIIHPAINNNPLLDELKEKILPNISYQPEPKNIFRAFSLPMSSFKICIIGQDGYISKEKASGLSYIAKDLSINPSQEVIYKELEKEGFENHDINKWFNQGVLLLNTALTVETGNPGSHLKYWEQFSEEVIKRFSKDNPCIWILWGKHAQNFQKFIYKPVDTNLYDMKDIYHIPIDPECNYVLKSAHPTSEIFVEGKAGFYGNNHFLKSNVLLKLFNKKEIEW
jgi:uracil-DNA glycosylase